MFQKCSHYQKKKKNFSFAFFFSLLLCCQKFGNKFFLSFFGECKIFVYVTVGIPLYTMLIFIQSLIIFAWLRLLVKFQPAM